MLVDLHVLVHEGDTEALLETLPATSLDALCLVDLGRLPDADLVARAREKGKLVFVGAQVPLTRGHIIAFPPSADADPAALVADLNDEDDKVRALLDAGCALVPCHPYDKDSGYALGDWVVQHAGFNALITVTATSPIAANDLALEILDSLGIPAAGGTGGDGPVGKAATLFAARFETQEGLVDELKRGDCWALSVGEEDRWSSVERRDDRGRDRGGRDRDRGGRDRGGRDRGGRDRGGRDRGGRDRGGRDRGGRDRGGRDRDRGGREGGGREGGGREGGGREGGGREGGGRDRGGRDRGGRGGRGGRDRGDRERSRAPREVDGNRIPADGADPEINGNRADVDLNQVPDPSFD